MSATMENQQSSREGTLMPREVIVWLRGLCLPRAVRHPKRDFSNGFLVALICSRFWPNLSMHTYEDNLSVSNKQRNWEQLRKQFAANGCPLSDRMIDGMIECRDGYADSFVCQLYSQLTGRAIVEAAPLPTGKAVPTPVFVPQVASQLRPRDRTDSERASAERPAAEKPRGAVPVESRVRELTFRSPLHMTAKQQLQQDREDAPPTALALRQSMRALDSTDAQDGSGDARPPVAFAVSVRRAMAVRTVVRDDLSCAEGSASNDCGATANVSTALDRNATAAELIEWIVRTEATRFSWSCEVEDKDGSATAMPYTAHFLREESSLDPLMQCHVWGALFANVEDAAERARRGGGSVAPVAALMLRPQSSPREQLGSSTANSFNSVENSRASSCSLSNSMNSSQRPGASQRLAFLAALLAAIAGADPFLSAPAFVHDVLPHAAGPMRRVDHSNVDGFAGLFCAALPGERRLAAQLLPGLLAATLEAVTRPETVEARRSFILLLRAILVRLARGVWRGGGNASLSVRNFRNSTTLTAAAIASSSPVDVSEVDGSEPLSCAIAAAGGPHIVAALSHDSADVRLCGASLAEALAACVAPPSLLFGPALFLLLRVGRGGGGGGAGGVALQCLRAAWLRAALRRYAISPESPPCAAAAPLLAEFLRDVCRVLRAPGQPRGHAFIAQQVALSLGSLVDPCFNAEEAAVAAIKALDAAPPECIAMFLGPVNNSPHLQRQSSALVKCALLGSLRVDGGMRDCQPLQLAEAVLTVFPPDTDDRKEEDTNVSAKRRQSYSREMYHMAADMLHEGVIPTGMAKRIVWLYRICVGCRDAAEAFPEKPSFITEASATERWGQVMRAMYRDLSTVSMAAEMLFAQKLAMVDDASNTIGQMAGTAQQLIVRWYEEASRMSASSNTNSNLIIFNNNTNAKPKNAVESQEQITKAMQWYQATFSGESQDEVKSVKISGGRNTSVTSASSKGK